MHSYSVAGLEAEDAAGEAVGDGVVEMFAGTEDAFAADADQRKRLAPSGVADLAELDGDGGVAVGVAGDGPLEAEVLEGGVLDVEGAGLRGGLGLEGCG